MSDRPISAHLTRDLDPTAIDDVWDRIEANRGHAKHSQWKWALAFAAFAATVVALVVTWRGGSIERPTSVRLASGTPLPPSLLGDVALDDGSHVIVGGGASLVPAVNTGGALALTQATGTVTFDVKPHGPRSWTIDAGIARVRVLGTRFRVSRAPHRVRVDVERGLVLVTSDHIEGGERNVKAGEFVEVTDGLETTPPRPSVPSISTYEPASAPAAPAPTVKVSAQSPNTTPWRPLVEKGDYHAAYDALGHENVAVETRRASTVEDLLQIADVARLSGHPRDAVPPLERLVAVHASDPRAATAAFTLGKVQLDALGAPVPAAAAFEKAIALGLPEALREDAFARRVEAYAKAGDPERAKVARAAYEQAFPRGHHREAVERWWR